MTTASTSNFVSSTGGLVSYIATCTTIRLSILEASYDSGAESFTTKTHQNRGVLHFYNNCEQERQVTTPSEAPSDCRTHASLPDTLTETRTFTLYKVQTSHLTINCLSLCFIQIEESGRGDAFESVQVSMPSCPNVISTPIGCRQTFRLQSQYLYEF